MFGFKWMVCSAVLGATLLTSSPVCAQGTTQLKGIDAVLGRIYTMGKKGSQVQVIVRSVEYTIAPTFIGTTVYTPKKDEKLMVVKFQVQNAEKGNQSLAWSTLHFTAVGADDSNHIYAQAIGNALNQQSAAMSMKAAQKVECYTIIRVPAKGEMPKLIVERSVEPILRFNLKGKAKPLAAPYADPSDAYSVADEITGQIGTGYISDTFEFTVVKINAPAAQFGKAKPGKGKQFIAVELRVKNLDHNDSSVIWTTFKCDISDGKWMQNVYNADGKGGALKVDAGKSITVYELFEIEADAKPTDITVTSRDGRKTIYKL